MHNEAMEKFGNVVDVTAIAMAAKLRGITQKQIAEAIGASQSQVSRVLSGVSNQRSKLIEKICIYVGYAPQAVSADSVRRNKELIEALAVTWDGTPQHSAALATVIRSLRVLAPDVASTSRK